jgi:3D (Asp-Asp-Asp) domain-containing protein
MKAILLALLLLMPLQAREMMARVTYYVDHQTALGVKPKEGVTIAAASDIPMGTKIHIPQLKEINGTGVFIKQDVGPAVEKRTASRGKYPIIDVYVSSKDKIKTYSKKYPALVLIYVK